METINLSPEAAATLRWIIEFHAQNDEPDAGYYERESFEELCGVLNVPLYPVAESEPGLFETPSEVNPVG